MIPIKPTTKEDLPRYTGKYLVSVNPRSQKKTIMTMAKEKSVNLACSADYKNRLQDYHKAFEEADGIFFEECKIVVVNQHKEKEIAELTRQAKSKNTFYYYEPERYVYTYEDSFEMYMRGYKDAVNHLYNRMKKGGDRVRFIQEEYKDNDAASWGIQAIGVLETQLTGKGVKIAVLDTGFNLSHPDFTDRKITSKSFIQGQEVEDGNGHGSHCIGIAAGYRNQESGRRYGVAYDSEIFVGKVLSNAGSGSDSGILAGLEWAISEGCKVISMSLGAPVREGESYSNIYNDLGKRALEKGTLIIAAAGNESRRDIGRIAPVGHPANCPSIMAVGALDSKLEVGYFSNGGINPDGGQIDVVAPGVDIYSSWKDPENYQIISGTSMATPYVAGMAALYWEENPGVNASDIWNYISQGAKRLDLPASDIGSGIVRPPKSASHLLL